MTNKKPWPVVGVFGHYGNENLGDEAIITAVLQNLHKLWPDVEARCFSVVPEDSARRYGVPAFPIRWRPASVSPPPAKTTVAETHPGPAGMSVKERLKRVPVLGLAIRGAGTLLHYLRELRRELGFLRESYRAVKSLDLLMITGSNQFLDNFGGPWGFPYTLLKWSVLARLAGVRVFYVSVGAGPLDARSSRFLVRCALWFADYLSLRDEPSRQLIASTGSTRKGLVYPDLAHSLDMSRVEGQASPADSEVRRIGINPMPMYDSRYWCETDDTRYREYVGKLVEFSAWLIGEGYELFFFPTQPKDELVIDDITGELAARGLDSTGMKRSSRQVYELMDTLQTADLVVATRFHGTVLSLLSARPTLAICYYRKTADLMKEMGQERYALPLDGLSVEDMVTRFRELVDRRTMEVEKICARNREYVRLLDEQYNRIAGLIGGSELQVAKHPAESNG